MVSFKFAVLLTAATFTLGVSAYAIPGLNLPVREGLSPGNLGLMPPNGDDAMDPAHSSNPNSPTGAGSGHNKFGLPGLSGIPDLIKSGEVKLNPSSIVRGVWKQNVAAAKGTINKMTGGVLGGSLTGTTSSNLATSPKSGGLESSGPMGTGSRLPGDLSGMVGKSDGSSDLM